QRVLDSERSDECIDFTMMCFFIFFFVCLLTSRNNAPISNFGGGFRCKSEYPWCIIEFSKKSRKTKKKKNDGKTGIFTQNKFSTKSIFLYGCNSETNHCKFLKFSPNIYVISIKKILDDQKVPYEFSNFYEICRKRENLQRNDNDLSSNDFKYFISRRYLTILPVIMIGVFFTAIYRQLKFSIFLKIYLIAIKIQTTFFTNHWKLYPMLTNHLRSESFFVYNDNYYWIQI
ncbi:Uncharacterized protein FWK35_00023772, partial [Aphis craccivora]